MSLVHALAIGFMVAAGGHASEEAAGASAAAAWLALVDDGEYGKSWEEASAVVRQTVSEVKWEEALDSVRIPLGRAHARKLLSAHYVESLPQAPAGKYVVIQYQTSFDGRDSTVETVTTQLDPQGIWRVSRYYAR